MIELNIQWHQCTYKHNFFSNNYTDTPSGITRMPRVHSCDVRRLQGHVTIPTQSFYTSFGIPWKDVRTSSSPTVSWWITTLNHNYYQWHHPSTKVIMNRWLSWKYVHLSVGIVFASSGTRTFTDRVRSNLIPVYMGPEAQELKYRKITIKAISLFWTVLDSSCTDPNKCLWRCEFADCWSVVGGLRHNLCKKLFSGVQRTYYLKHTRAIRL